MKFGDELKICDGKVSRVFGPTFSLGMGVYVNEMAMELVAEGGSEQVARTVAASFNSYRRNFGNRAVDAAESDMLGEVRDLLISAVAGIEQFCEQQGYDSSDDEFLNEAKRVLGRFRSYADGE